MDQEIAIQAELERLETAHKHYEKLLAELVATPYPNADQQMEELRLKKLKLQTKDLIENLRHQHVMA